MSTLIASLITALAPVLWVATLLGLPGNWGLLLMACVVSYFAPTGVHVSISPWTILFLALFAITGEVLELVAGAAGAKKLGGTKRGSALSIVGSIIGAIVGAIFGSTVPVIGNLVAALVLGALGAFGGAVAGERWAGKEWDDCIKIGWGALCGKLLGTVLKTSCGTAMMVLVVYAVWT